MNETLTRQDRRVLQPVPAGSQRGQRCRRAAVQAAHLGCSAGKRITPNALEAQQCIAWRQQQESARGQRLLPAAAPGLAASTSLTAVAAVQAAPGH